jgi:polysaccharide pyruvyl transferase WcaK-like protein
MGDRLYLVGSGGNPNYGDELIVASWLRFLAKVRPDDDVWLDCPQPGTAAALFAGLHPSLHTTNTLWRSCAEAPDQTAHEVWDHVGHLVTHGGTSEYDVGLLELGKAHSVHLVGGGYVNGIWPDHAGLVSGISAAGRMSGATLVASGLGLMPLPDNAEQLRKSFDEFSAVSARDELSAEFLGRKTGLDDGFLGLPHELTRSTSSPVAQSRAKDVMLCIQSDMTNASMFSRLRDKLRVVVENSLNNGLSVGYVEAIPGSDRQMFEALDGLIEPENFIPFIQVWNDGLPVRRRQSWYTSRFHPHMVAAAAGAKGVAVGILDDYYDVKHGSLLSLGSGWTYASAIDDDELPMPSGSPDFADKAIHFANRKRTEALSLYPVH